MKTTPDIRTDVVNDRIRLSQQTTGLTFGTDAYLLSAYVRTVKNGLGVDLGSGTGIIPLLCLGRDKLSHFTAIEIQPSFAELIRHNALQNELSHRLSAVCADVRTMDGAVSDLLGKVDVVTANPPYMAADTGFKNQHDEKYIARHEVNGTIADFCNAAARLLKFSGRFYCVWRPDRLTDLMTALRSSGLEPKRMTMVQATWAARPSMVLVEAVRGAAPSLTVTPPLCLWEPDSAIAEQPRTPLSPTQDAEEIYDHCAFPDRFLPTNRTRKPVQNAEKD